MTPLLTDIEGFMSDVAPSLLTCSACGATVFPGATDCPRCGRLLVSAAAPHHVQRTTDVAQWPFRADVELPRYVLRATLAAAIGSAVLLALVFGAVRLLRADVAPPPPVGFTVLDILGAVLFAPLLETLVLAGVLHVLSGWLRAWPAVAATAALLAGLAHGAIAPLWFFAPAWSFFVYAAAFLAWRPRSWRNAYLAAALPHALLNLMAVAAARLL